jgi:hypothetical protein
VEVAGWESRGIVREGIGESEGGCGPDIDASGLTYRCGMLLWSGSMVNQCCRKGGWVAERGGGNKYKHSTDRVNCIQFALA